jgi:hypothetical protein
MKHLKTLAAGTLAATAVLVSGTGAWADGTSATTTPPIPSTCVVGGHDPWPVIVDGTPDFHAGDNGAYLWHVPLEGWSVRVSHPGNGHEIISGEISSTGRLGGVVEIRDEPNDIVYLAPDGHALFFVFQNYGAVDGVDFRTDCAPSLRVSIQIDGREAPTSAVHLGAQATAPIANPFVIERALQPGQTGSIVAATDPDPVIPTTVVPPASSTTS